MPTDFLKVSLKKLGEGTYGTVYLIEGTKLAVKTFSKENMMSEDNWEREKKIFEALSCPKAEKYVICAHEYGETSDFYYIIMDRVDGHDLFDVMDCMDKSGMYYTDDEYVALAKHLITAVGYIHSKGIVHGDIKPENVMFDNNKLVLIDYGLACFAGVNGGGCDWMVGTKEFLAPEYFKKPKKREFIIRTYKGDIFALGITLYELVFGEHPYQNWVDKDRKKFWAFMRNTYHVGYSTTDKESYPKMSRIIESCLLSHPEDRPTAEELLKIAEY